MKQGVHLEPVFKETISRFTGDTDVINFLWQDIEKKYKSPSRYYHNLAHLDSLVAALQPVKDKIHDWDIVVPAIAYHDIVYSIRKNDNEERSAKYAPKALSGIVPAEKRELLSQFIIATKAHSVNENEDINHFTDADLSILGSPPEEYVSYTKQIRKEYRLYPMFIYKPGRIKVIRHFLDMDAIFKTGFFHDRLEEQAKENLRRELDELSR